jgi:hypothetical protein
MIRGFVHRPERRHGSSARPRMNLFRQVLTGLVMLLLGACTARQTYDAMSENQRTQCLKEPPSIQADCMAQTRMSFEDYLRRRSEAIENK